MNTAAARRAMRMTLVFSLSLLAFGCGQRAETERTTTQVPETERAEYEGSAQRRFAEFGAKIDSLKLQIDAAGANAKTEMREELKGLEQERDEAARKLEELRAASADRWRAARQETGDLLDALDARIRQARARVRGDST